MKPDDTLSDLLKKSPFRGNEGEIVQLTCVAKQHNPIRTVLVQCWVSIYLPSCVAQSKFYQF